MLWRLPLSQLLYHLQEPVTREWHYWLGIAMVTAPSSNGTAVAPIKLAGGLDKLTLDSLYDDAERRASQNVSYNRRETGPMANSMMQLVAHDPFYALNTIAAPNFLQMAAMAQQQQAFLQQQMMVGVQQSHPLATVNPFANPCGDVLYALVVPVQASNAYHGLI